MRLLRAYTSLTSAAEPLFDALLTMRLKRGKEVGPRLGERRGVSLQPRPDAPLVWVHAASVGESQSALILVDRLLQQDKNIRVLMTTGTVSSANMMKKNLPDGALHQFYPLDHPQWTSAFLDHWRPDLVLWMESELWPNMLGGLKQRGIPTVLVNARLSERSFKRWSMVHQTAREILSAFSLILTQSPEEAERYIALGAGNVVATGNLKYSAKPLPFNETDLRNLTGAVGNRPLWVYASSHQGEEALACRVHQKLRPVFPELLTVIVPRHPERRHDIEEVLWAHGLPYTLRGDQKKLPKDDDAVYVADTFGELGLFYRLAPVALIGRSFSDDGGGGHNPIEAAQLNAAVLYGPNVQYQRELYADMREADAAVCVKNEQQLTDTLRDYLINDQRCEAARRAAFEFTATRGRVIETVLTALKPWLEFPNQRKQAS